MKAELVGHHRIYSEHEDASKKTAVLPAIDSWGAYWRTIVAIYFFESYSGLDVFSDLRKSLSRALDRVPHLTGTLEPTSIKTSDEPVRTFRRVKVTWGSGTPGGELLECKTNARIKSLIPPSAQASSFVWDRSDKALEALFPKCLSETSGLRIQLTKFTCGGFSIAIDMDHALADAYTVALFIGYWSSVHNQMFPTTAEPCQSAKLPDLLFSPSIVEDKIPSDGKKLLMLEKSTHLPTRRPDFRFLSAPNKEIIVSRDGPIPNMKRPNSVSTQYLFHVSEYDYERITRGVQATADVQVTDQIAFTAFLWAALNQARLHCGRHSLDLHLSLSLRWTLGLPEGLVGSPLVAVMFDSGEDLHTVRRRPSVLATAITETLEKYTEDALLGIVYDASMRDSPTSSSRGTEKSERMELTSGVGSISSAPIFGSCRPLFMAPPALPVENLFIMADCLSSNAGTTAKRYADGYNIFVSLPRDVYCSLIQDPAFSAFEVLDDL
ncbi:transferase family protein-like protein [Pseudovirgaria hyperparasitica]|uniref:Transferase family protein-like protein n=1 Tax=Pseudovirgaria hyperparasitica TaxID=470096 RepID=A0A6A6VYK6_9PEZI|nr:transferase family protein-like protein [Pseudovirgaria hyperparasitica]KAF2754939.1 transferase family protein-like protein [Pseudovirgaria hyperparasitica]